MRVLVTGAGGFAGAHVCACLLKNTGLWKNIRLFAGVYDEKEQTGFLKGLEEYAAITEEDSRIRILRTDLTNPAEADRMAAEARPDYVLHLAAQSSVSLSFQKPELTMAVNVDGTANLLAALRRHSPKARILIVGSADQYGNVEESRQPIKETEPLAGQSPYGESKILQERLALDCVTRYGQDILLVRAAPHIGRGQSRRFVIADWTAQIREMQEGKRPHKLTVGNTNVIRDMTDVRDIVSAYLLLLKKGKSGEIYNVGSGKGVRLSDIPPVLARIAGISDLELQIDPDRFRPADIPVLVADNTKLRACTGWQPQYTLEQTLTDLLYGDEEIDKK